MAHCLVILQATHRLQCWWPEGNEWWWRLDPQHLGGICCDIAPSCTREPIRYRVRNYPRTFVSFWRVLCRLAASLRIWYRSISALPPPSPGWGVWFWKILPAGRCLRDKTMTDCRVVIARSSSYGILLSSALCYFFGSRLCSSFDWTSFQLFWFAGVVL